MKISVIIPMYNSASTIENTIKSVLEQSYREEIEIIVINDGSKDNCEKKIENIILNNNTNRIIKLINKQNGGVSSARNIGIRESKGEYLAFLDSDDTWHPQKIELILEIFKNNSIKFLGHSYTLENNFNKVYQVIKTYKVSFTKLLLRNFAVTPSIVIKRDICEYFNEDMNYTEDHELWLRISLKHKVYYLDLPLTLLGRPVLSNGGLSSNKWAMRLGEFKMYKNIVSHKKFLIPLYPLLIIFSYVKHFRHIVINLLSKIKFGFN